MQNWKCVCVCVSTHFDKKTHICRNESRSTVIRCDLFLGYIYSSACPWWIMLETFVIVLISHRHFQISFRFLNSAVHDVTLICGFMKHWWSLFGLKNDSGHSARKLRENVMTWKELITKDFVATKSFISLAALWEWELYFYLFSSLDTHKK